MTGMDVYGSGMVSGVGFTADASCAAIRTGITGFVETKFFFDGAWLLGCPVPFDRAWRGRERLLQMLVPAIRECLAGGPERLDGAVPLLLCVAEPERPGRLEGLDKSLLPEVQERLGVRLHPASRVIPGGRVAGVDALAHARELLAGDTRYCVVAGVDSMLTAGTLKWHHEHRRLMTSDNADGFIPGEAAAAVLLGPAADGGTRRTRCLGWGAGVENAPIDSDDPLRADGLVQAIRAALSDAGVKWDALHYRITDLSGLQYGFKEAALAIARTLRPVKSEFTLWHPADCVGEVGAAIGPVVLAVAEHALRRGYMPGPGALCHFGNDDGQRRALVLGAC